ncbi:hypothetical protein Bpfe_009645, partial [Biomphalaria pfeifferi]
SLLFCRPSETRNNSQNPDTFFHEKCDSRVAKLNQIATCLGAWPVPKVRARIVSATSIENLLALKCKTP